MDIINFAFTCAKKRLVKDVFNYLSDKLLPEQVADIISIFDVSFIYADKETREYGGGERHYLSRTTDEDIINNVRRNARIRQAWKMGESIQIIADRHGIHRSTVYRIISGQL